MRNRRKPNRVPSLVVTALALASAGVVPSTAQDAAAPDAKPAGREESAKTKALETGLRVLQSNAPVEQLNVHLSGFHPLKGEPSHQMEAHHFCKQVNEDFAQCALFDGDTAAANLNGIEYIISVNSYGKTWHVWDTGHHGEGSRDPIPYGEARLAWSFNRDGEIQKDLVEHRDRRMKTDIGAIREKRRDLTALAKPQGGVDDLVGKFKGPTKEIPGVVARKPK